MDFILSPEIIFLLFSVAAIAGCVDAIAGGGGLIVIPTLLSLGIPTEIVLATNKLQASGGSFTAASYFVKKKIVNLREMIFPIGMTFIGALLGAFLILQIDSNKLKVIIPIFLVAIALYLAFAPKIGVEDKPAKLTWISFGLLCALPLGFYDGFFGPGAGSLLALSFVSLLGFNLTKATGHAKVLNFISNIASLLYFIFSGKIFWTIGFIMMAGQIFGAYIGARLAVKKGQVLIRRVMVVVCIIISIKIILDHFSIKLF